MDNEIKKKINALFDEANEAAANGCGLVYELYEERLFNSLDSIIGAMAECEQDSGIEIAKSRFGYLNSEERLKQEKDLADSGEPDWREGLCKHYLEPDTCPLGCG